MLHRAKERAACTPRPGGGREKGAPQILMSTFVTAYRDTMQNRTPQELISHISPFNIHIHLIRQRNRSSHDLQLAL